MTLRVTASKLEKVLSDAAHDVKVRNLFGGGEYKLFAAPFVFGHSWASPNFSPFDASSPTPVESLNREIFLEGLRSAWRHHEAELAEASDRVDLSIINVASMFGCAAASTYRTVKGDAVIGKAAIIGAAAAFGIHNHTTLSSPLVVTGDGAASEGYSVLKDRQDFLPMCMSVNDDDWGWEFDDSASGDYSDKYAQCNPACLEICSSNDFPRFGTDQGAQDSNKRVLDFSPGASDRYNSDGEASWDDQQYYQYEGPLGGRNTGTSRYKDDSRYGTAMYGPIAAINTDQIPGSTGGQYYNPTIGTKAVLVAEHNLLNHLMLRFLFGDLYRPLSDNTPLAYESLWPGDRTFIDTFEWQDIDAEHTGLVNQGFDRMFELHVSDWLPNGSDHLTPPTVAHGTFPSTRIWAGAAMYGEGTSDEDLQRFTLDNHGCYLAFGCDQVVSSCMYNENGAPCFHSDLISSSCNLTPEAALLGYYLSQGRWGGTFLCVSEHEFDPYNWFTDFRDSDLRMKACLKARA